MTSMINNPLLERDEFTGPASPNGNGRAQTFTRAFTFDTNYGNGFRKATTQFGRTVTDFVGITYTSEEQWTKSLIADYMRNVNKNVDGDLPLPGGFGREYRFWRMVVLAGTFGCIMGFIGMAFLNFSDQTPKYWTNNLEDATAAELGYWKGDPRWIAVTVGSGFTVGLLRYLMNYPEQIDGIFKEINTYHVDHTIAPQTILLSCISLAGGATLGPEQALGTVGGGLACWALQYLPQLDEDDRKLLVLIGMTAAIGGLFPSPILTVLMMYELGNPPKSTMESMTLLTVAAVGAFTVYYAIVSTGKTWLDTVETQGIFFSYAWEYSNWNCVTALVIGVICAALSLLCIVFIGVTKQIFIRMRKRLERNKFLQAIIPPMVCGAIIGVCNWAMPLTVGNGNQLLTRIINYGFSKSLTSNELLSAAFCRMFLLGCSMNCVGYVGGFIFPIITISLMAGVIAWQNYPYLPFGLCIGCFLSSLAGGICPMPMTLACLAIFCFFFGMYQTAPILIATMTSYTLVSGSGLFAALQARAKEQEMKEAQAAEAEEKAAKYGRRVPAPVDKGAIDAMKAEKQKEDLLSMAMYTYSKSNGANDNL